MTNSFNQSVIDSRENNRKSGTQVSKDFHKPLGWEKLYATWSTITANVIHSPTGPFQGISDNDKAAEAKITGIHWNNSNVRNYEM